MTKADKAVTTDAEPVEGSATEPAPHMTEWHDYKLKSLAVSAAAINGKYVRVQELGGGFQAVEVEGLPPFITEEPREVCLNIGEKSAWVGRLIRRYTLASGEEEYR